MYNNRIRLWKVYQKDRYRSIGEAILAVIPGLLFI